MFRRIAVVNRGEAAMRLVHAARDHNAGGVEPLDTVALYTEAEGRAVIVREADLAYPLGAASATSRHSSCTRSSANCMKVHTVRRM
jgi:acetyl/propionyl-CoA carboxylase alpha subunit